MNQSNKNKYKRCLFFFYSVALILCITFAVPINDEFLFDFRDVLLVLGTLYGGPYVGVGLYGVSVSYRMLIDGFGVINTVVGNGLIVLASILVLQKFHQSSFKKKTIIALTLSCVSSISTGITTMLNYPITPTLLILWFLELLANTLCMFIVLYLAETVKKYFRLREEMIHSEKNKLVSHLAASISHEIRNPLTSVKGFLQLMFEKEQDLQKLRYIQISLNEINKAESIINDYLTFSKPTGKNLEIINIQKSIKDTINVLFPLAKSNRVEIQSKHLQPYLIKGNNQLFQQAFLNILKNSIEAMDNGGTITLKSIELNDHIVISIEDTGIGMAKDQLQRLGQPYYSTKGSKGTGLGLMVTYKIIESMDGLITVRSETHKGTFFEITLPIAKNKGLVEEAVQLDEDRKNQEGA
jgi:two-component system sporulation sensor kinase B